ncbi:MAG: hypothetical protein HZA17_07240 [Nitrospirae bacterium]|nr:hypothetical protein [Nitrospirota bacterium]
MRKLLIFLLIPLCAVFFRYGEASAFPKSDQECIKCHTLSADQAKEVFNELIPGLKILGIQDSPLKGLWEVSMESGGKKGILYLDYSKKKLFAGSLVDIKTKVNHTQESFSKLNTADISQIPLDNALVMGDKNAKHKVVVFDDPD